MGEKKKLFLFWGMGGAREPTTSRIFLLAPLAQIAIRTIQTFEALSWTLCPLAPCPGGGGGGTPQFWTPTTPSTNCWP